MLEILYKDTHLVAINKPAGLLVHRSLIDKGETQFALQLVRDQIGQYVYPLHRLDKPTSGVLVFALDKETARAMSIGLQSHACHKTYLSVVRGYINKQGVIDYPLQEQLDKMTDAKARDNKAAQEAVTAYARIATLELPFAVSRYKTARYSLVRLMPKTGRKHQLRRHMKHLLHPIVGDTTHGRGEHNRFFRERFGSHRLLLHAQTLRFIHPKSHKEICIEADIDDVFQRVLQHVDWNRDTI